MRRDRADDGYLQDMLVAGEAVLRYLSGKSRDIYDGDEILRDAVEKRIEIFGEAARNVSRETQDSHPEIPWRKIKSTRHILAHDYGEVDHDIVWRIATEHIPETMIDLRKLVPPLPPEELPES